MLYRIYTHCYAEGGMNISGVQIFCDRPLDNLPPFCPCAEWFTVDYAQICKLSGFIHMCHDDPTHFLVTCMKEVHNDVESELQLQPLMGDTFRHHIANTEPDHGQMSEQMISV